ncbi:hypothetical protein [Cellulomonas marina]|uniref:Uncharacterized protein n=1 Tax=Cellulomonas marina TaxID=988821 RepID=A0A1I0ZXI7_9CELL|nr:hypothetical protein [Cellulomonas marina]GIG28774.1 hypothetical protein Cma02nite_13740 [Cellulomonas marina]SFB28813.1 hypothetical protein SAMN05421867_112121 [Cellulomonas marina]
MSQPTTDPRPLARPVPRPPVPRAALARPSADAGTPDRAVATEDAAIADEYDVAVEEALRTLDGLVDRPLAEHPGAYEAVHAALQDRLADPGR